MPTPPIEIYIGDLVQMRKQHPCGGDTWRVVRVGAEIGIRCATCDRKVLLPRSKKPLEFDANGFPVSQRSPSFATRVARLLNP